MLNPRIIVIFLLCIHKIRSFNLSPTPNVIIKKQDVYSKYKVFIEQERSSFLGFSINLRKSHVIISAPRAQPIVEEQKLTEEPGAIFKCDFNANVSVESCNEYILDKREDFIEVSLHKSRKVIDSETKDSQLLGFSMDGGDSENDKFVVCAPHLRASPQAAEANITMKYNMNGLCSLLLDTVSKVPKNHTKIAPLRFFDRQDLGKGKKTIVDYKYAESGFSVHMTENNAEVIIGCPGIYDWRGSVIRYSLNQKQDSEQVPNDTFHIDYEADVLLTRYSQMISDSYFGYSVSSAKFLGTNKTFYVASAPRVKEIGLVYIFDIVTHNKTEKKIDIRKKISGSRYGEYFGYAVLCEDFNGDGLMDIAASAPFYTKDGLNDNGAVYVFINKGKLNFDNQTLLLTEYKGSGMFGMSMSKIGDINLDGYNDLMVSAPFENDGVVYIFLGGPLGISTTPSQRIEAPKVDPHKYEESFTNPMFGFGLSRGVDIDGNGYKDVAIGAPNAEIVYIYRSYPVIWINGMLNTSKSEIKFGTKAVNVSFCARYSSTSKFNVEIGIKTTLTLDTVHNRASVSKNGANKNIIRDTIALTKVEKCLHYKVDIRANLADIFSPITIQMDFDTKDKISENNSTFCSTCAVIDPLYPTSLDKQIKFSTGCKNKTCLPDLSVVGTLQNLTQPFIIGSEKIIKIEYKITNAGEPAYSTLLKIEISSNSTKFSKIPPACSHDEKTQNVMTCDINNKNPIDDEGGATLNITIDVTKIEGKVLKITAEVSSIGNEKKPDDNKFINEVLLAEFSAVKLNGWGSPSELHLSDKLIQNNLTYQYQMFNYGPSNIKKLLISLQMPVFYIQKPNINVQIVEFDEMNVTISHKNKDVEVKWIKNEKILGNSEENSLKKKVIQDPDSSVLGFDYEINHQEPNQEPIHMNKRSIDPYLVSEEGGYREHNLNIINNTNESSQNRQEGQNLMKLPTNRTIFFDCSNPDNAEGCIEAKFILEDFPPENEPVTISLNFSLNLEEFDKIFTSTKNIFVFKPNVKLHRIGDGNLTQTLNVSIKNPYTIIYENIIIEVPLEVYIMSGVIGLLVMILVLWGLKNCGFFEREKKVELQKLKRESMALTARQMEDLKKQCEDGRSHDFWRGGGEDHFWPKDPSK